MKRIAVLVLALLITMPMAGQQTGITRTELQRHDLNAAGRETVQSRIDFAPEAAFPRHTHPGEEIICVLEGTLEYQVEGKPLVVIVE